MGHFVPHEDQLLPPFVEVDTAAAKLMAPIVGASESEVAVMGTLTANLHFLMASFYQPTDEKYKIILEGKAFPSDHVRNQIFSAQKYLISRQSKMLTRDHCSMQSSHRLCTTSVTPSRPWS